MRGDAAERWLQTNDRKWRKKRKKKDYEEMMWNKRRRGDGRRNVVCPKCGGKTKTIQVNNIKTENCDHCGPLPYGIDVKTGKTVKVKR